MQSDGQHHKGRRVADRYHLLEPIGQGGMGVVWRAHDTLLDRTVAVKEVRYGGGLGDETHMLNRRMMREARAAARLTHPNVVIVYDVIEEDNRPWIVMQMVPSRSLGQVIKAEGPLKPRRVAEIGLNLVDALRGAHRAGVLHRDVKPENVLLADDGRVVLTDFGIATLEAETALTMTGLAGTPAFIAPERLRGLPARRESDLWSLGATLYAAVEGKSPHDRGLAMATMHSVLNDEPGPPRLAGPLYPVLEGLLRKEPVQRLTYDEATAMLRKVVEGHSPTMPFGMVPPKPQARPSKPAGPSIPETGHHAHPPVSGRPLSGRNQRPGKDPYGRQTPAAFEADDGDMATRKARVPKPGTASTARPPVAGRLPGATGRSGDAAAKAAREAEAKAAREAEERAAREAAEKAARLKAAREAAAKAAQEAEAKAAREAEEKAAREAAEKAARLKAAREAAAKAAQEAEAKAAKEAEEKAAREAAEKDAADGQDAESGSATAEDEPSKTKSKKSGTSGTKRASARTGTASGTGATGDAKPESGSLSDDDAANTDSTGSGKRPSARKSTGSSSAGASNASKSGTGARPKAQAKADEEKSSDSPADAAEPGTESGEKEPASPEKTTGSTPAKPGAKGKSDTKKKPAADSTEDGASPADSDAKDVNGEAGGEAPDIALGSAAFAVGREDDTDTSPSLVIPAVSLDGPAWPDVSVSTSERILGTDAKHEKAAAASFDLVGDAAAGLDPVGLPAAGADPADPATTKFGAEEISLDLSAKAGNDVGKAGSTGSKAAARGAVGRAPYDTSFAAEATRVADGALDPAPSGKSPKSGKALPSVGGYGRPAAREAAGASAVPGWEVPEPDAAPYIGNATAKLPTPPRPGHEAQPPPGRNKGGDGQSTVMGLRPSVPPRPPSPLRKVVPAVVVAVIVVAMVSLYLGMRSGNTAGSPDPSATTSATTEPEGEKSSSPGGSPQAAPVPNPPQANEPAPSKTAEPAPEKSEPAAALPAGWKMYKDDKMGFSVGLPKGWKPFVRTRNAVRFRGPGASPQSYLLIEEADNPKSDPVKDWRKLERTARYNFGGYKFKFIKKVDYQKSASDWEFTWRANSGLARVRNRGFLTDNGRGYAIYWHTASSKWKKHLRFFNGFADTFKPAK
ncbi:serine/threonine-protein kinase [Sinosporangium siamense]|uniref:non-specific serine/threonine protein kinase n=1 Tax=Sinosporangium siamense TaxID=1367973 RepID=A0A919RAW9_9ACTN|nr:serine/threonine-protein kinase [Sinosporangium siamense]GII90338.1 hypothetical protein Ssi02_05690 [Sinosporangium siamense]